MRGVKEERSRWWVVRVGSPPCETRCLYRRPGQAGCETRARVETPRHARAFSRLQFFPPEASEDRKKTKKNSLRRLVQLFFRTIIPARWCSHRLLVYIYFFIFFSHPPPPHAVTLSFKLYLSFGFSPRESFQAERGLSGAKSLSREIKGRQRDW